MKVILKQDIPDLGEEDSVVNVSDGYARNYLLPRKMAVLSSLSELARVEKRKAEREKKQAAKRAEFEELAKKLAEQEILIPADAGEEGKLFGSVTSQDIARAVQTTAGIEIDKKRIELSDPIKVVGEYNVPVKLFKDISAILKIKVVAK